MDERQISFPYIFLVIVMMESMPRGCLRHRWCIPCHRYRTTWFRQLFALFGFVALRATSLFFAHRQTWFGSIFRRFRQSTAPVLAAYVANGFL
jgi:hypothetical protein